MNSESMNAIIERCYIHCNNVYSNEHTNEDWVYGYKKGAVEQDGIARKERTEEILKLLEDVEWEDMNCKGMISRLIEKVKQL